MKPFPVLFALVLLFTGCQKWFEPPRREIELRGQVVDQFGRPVPDLELILGENGTLVGLGGYREPTYESQRLKTGRDGWFNVTFTDRTATCPVKEYLSRFYLTNAQPIVRNDSLFRYEISAKTSAAEPTCRATARGYTADVRIFVTEYFIK